MRKIISIVVGLLFVVSAHAQVTATQMMGVGMNAELATVVEGIGINRTGSTISLQEGTPASACMGAATPNGTTNVVVTTSCATTGSRIFYSHTGAVANLGNLSTTVAPNGTSFSFASSNASDNVASSAIWMVIKETP